jgi:hypothetical protein
LHSVECLANKPIFNCHLKQLLYSAPLVKGEMGHCRMAWRWDSSGSCRAAEIVCTFRRPVLLVKRNELNSSKSPLKLRPSGKTRKFCLFQWGCNGVCYNQAQQRAAGVKTE